MLIKIISVIVALGLGFMLYVRFAPSDAPQWSAPEVAATQVGDIAGERSFIAVRAVQGDDVLERLMRVALATPRTTLLSDGTGTWTTFVTRTRLMGYPDYTSVRLIDAEGQQLLQIYARARFGKLDMGVNKARVENWLAQLGLLTPQG